MIIKDFFHLPASASSDGAGGDANGDDDDNNGIALNDAAFAVITESTGLDGFECIIGLGYKDAAVGGVQTIVDQISSLLDNTNTNANSDSNSNRRTPFVMRTCQHQGTGSITFYDKDPGIAEQKIYHRLAGASSNTADSSRMFYNVVVIGIDVKQASGQQGDKTETSSRSALLCKFYNSPA